ncbi:MAG: hypothetical protein QNJ16_10570 [Rhodobacter sp.]|nr:hypothetical protein [Rhodobacter sp.]
MQSVSNTARINDGVATAVRAFVRCLFCLLLIAGTAACGRLGIDRIGLGSGAAGSKRNTVEINEVRYRSRVNVDSEDRRAFTITVTPAAGDPDAAREAGRYQATVYCLRNYGGSDTAWTAGPADDVPIADNTLILAGRCIQR